jgi:hypothetical protein
VAEIKSTLDLIMERTKDLLPSKEERKAFVEKEWSGKVRALLRRYLDGRTGVEALRSELSSLGEPQGLRLADVLNRDLPEWIDPDGDNERVFLLMEALGHGDGTGWKNLLREYRRRRTEREKALEQAALERLAARGIGGNAVRPNLETDPDFLDFREKERDALLRDLRATGDGGTSIPR